MYIVIIGTDEYRCRTLNFFLDSNINSYSLCAHYRDSQWSTVKSGTCFSYLSLNRQKWKTYAENTHVTYNLYDISYCMQWFWWHPLKCIGMVAYGFLPRKLLVLEATNGSIPTWPTGLVWILQSLRLGLAYASQFWLIVCVTKPHTKWWNINSLTASIYLLDVLVDTYFDNHWWNAKARTRYWIPFPGEIHNF